MRHTRRFAILAAAAALALTSCGDPGDDVYVTAPPAYGAAGHCYFIDSPAEAFALQAAGLCPVNWAPMAMPMTWRSQYAWYYDSPSYYGRYVPASSRTTYITHVHNYEAAHPQAVRTTPKAPRTRSSSSFRAGSGRQGGDVGTSRAKVGSRSSGFSSSGRSSSGGSRSSFRSGARR